MEELTLGELSNQAARKWGDREFLMFEGKRETFAQTQAAIDRLARALIGLGIQPGEKVSLWMTNRLEWIHAMFALAKIGAVMVPINTRFRTADLEYVVKQSDSTTLLTMEHAGPIRYLDMVLELCPELKHHKRDHWHCHAFPELKRVISVGKHHPIGVYSWEQALEAAESVPAEELRPREAAVKPDDTLFIMYTSGTTGFPKGVMQTHHVIRNSRHTAKMMRMTPDDCTILFLPLFHAFGYYEGAVVSYIAGSRMVLTETFNPAEILELIEKEKGTIIHGFDTHWQDLMDHPDFKKRDLSSMRSGILAAGLPSTVPVAERANREFCKTATGYGMTEIMPGALIGKCEDTFEHNTRTSGYPNEGYEFKVADGKTGERLPPGTPGEMCVRGYAVMQGYYKKPEETAKAIDAEGWFHTGDMGVEEPDGYYRFLGRYKEMLKVGGENVDPVEVEAYYLSHPAVNRIQIVGVADGRLSEIPVAFVVLEPGMAVTGDELAGFAKGKVASFKIPRHFFFVSEYPMTSTGKVKRFELRHIARENLGINAPDIEQGEPADTQS
ncbi:AMP-binding protein [Candidatus Sumerlaeota bacterium]|nr:AMP-binding protein [Candidatus Sumerlaeota bacterium]